MKHKIDDKIIMNPIEINPRSATKILSKLNRIAEIPIMNKSPPKIKFPIELNDKSHFLKFKSPFFLLVIFDFRCCLFLTFYYFYYYYLKND